MEDSKKIIALLEEIKERLKKLESANNFVKKENGQYEWREVSGGCWTARGGFGECNTYPVYVGGGGAGEGYRDATGTNGYPDQLNHVINSCAGEMNLSDDNKGAG